MKFEKICIIINVLLIIWLIEISGIFFFTYQGIHTSLFESTGIKTDR